MVFRKGNELWKLRKKLMKDKYLMIECACGCGKLRLKYNSCGVEKRYIDGHFTKSKKHREDHSKWMKERIIPEEKRIKLAKEISIRQLGKNNSFFGKHHTKEIIEQKRIKMVELWKDKKYRKILMENAIKMTSEISKKIKEDPEYAKNRIEKTLKGLMKRPTSFEDKIIKLCQKNKLPFIYTGDGRILIGCKNPDFICEEKKIIIEVFLNYFKIKGYGSVENYIKEREEYFAERGYKTIFIREEEITDKNWEEICLNKINIFLD